MDGRFYEPIVAPDLSFRGETAAEGRCKVTGSEAHQSHPLCVLLVPARKTLGRYLPVHGDPAQRPPGSISYMRSTVP